MCVHKRIEGPSGNVNDKKVRDGDVLTYMHALAYGFTDECTTIDDAFLNTFAVLTYMNASPVARWRLPRHLCQMSAW